MKALYLHVFVSIYVSVLGSIVITSDMLKLFKTLEDIYALSAFMM